MSSTRTLAVIIISSAAIVGCGGEMLAPRMDLARARTTWERASLDSYVYVVRRSCECLPLGMGPVEVEVISGVVTSRRYFDGTAVHPDNAAVFPDVPGMFALIEDALNRHPAHVRVEYDSRYGFPREVFVDFSTSIADEEMSYSTSLTRPGTIH